MPITESTIVISSPVLHVLRFLRQPGNIRSYLAGFVPPMGSLDAAAEPSAHRARWALAAEPSVNRFEWLLLAPYRAAGTLQVYGDCSTSQLWLTVTAAPTSVPPRDLHIAVRVVLVRIQRCVQHDLRDIAHEAETALQLTA